MNLIFQGHASEASLTIARFMRERQSLTNKFRKKARHARKAMRMRVRRSVWIHDEVLVHADDAFDIEQHMRNRMRFTNFTDVIASSSLFWTKGRI
jgi:hypothetical protein